MSKNESSYTLTAEDQMAALLSTYVYSSNSSSLPKKVEKTSLQELLNVSESCIEATNWASHSSLFLWTKGDKERYGSLSTVGHDWAHNL
jgi:hypothetical protein